MTIRIWAKENRFFIFEDVLALSRADYEYIIRKKIGVIEQEVGIFPKVNVVGIEIIRENKE